jgi:hypothetical protein
MASAGSRRSMMKSIMPADLGSVGVIFCCTKYTRASRHAGWRRGRGEQVRGVREKSKRI